MPITLHVSLLSGRTVASETELDVDVALFRRRAQMALSVGKGSLVHPSGSVLNDSMTLRDCELCSGDLSSLQMQAVTIRATTYTIVASIFFSIIPILPQYMNYPNPYSIYFRATRASQCAAFAVVLGDGSVLTWGYVDYGGDSSAVRDQLRNVQQIQVSKRAFAAILADGSVVTWGDAECGGDCSAVQDQLKSVQQIQANSVAFAAILADGSVLTWGDADSGGSSRAVQDQLKNVQQIQASKRAFAAILADGSVVTWGDARFGGNSSTVQDQLKHVQQIQASQGAFAAILADGSVVTWGDGSFGGNSSAVRDLLLP